MNTEQKIKELAEHLDIEVDEIEVTEYDDCSFEVGHGEYPDEYLVLTDEEADEKTREYIENSVWAFNAWFILDHAKLGDNADYGRTLQALEKTQRDACESCNDLILALIEDFNEFVEDAISADGRGHFLNPYDGTEEETESFFIYRVN